MKLKHDPSFTKGTSSLLTFHKLTADNVVEKISKALPVGSNCSIVFCAVYQEKTNDKKIKSTLSEEQKVSIRTAYKEANSEKMLFAYLDALKTALSHALIDVYTSQETKITEESLAIELPHKVYTTMAKLANACQRIPYRIATDKKYLPYTSTTHMDARKFITGRKLYKTLPTRHKEKAAL